MIWLLTLLNLSSPYQDQMRIGLDWQGDPSWYSYWVGAIGDLGFALFRVPEGVADPLDWGRQNQIDGIVWMEARTSGSTVTVRYKIIEVVYNIIVAEGSWSSPIPNERSLIEAFWVPIKQDMKDKIPSLRGSAVIIKAHPGTSLVNLTSELLTVDESGEIAVALRTPGVYRFRAIHPEYRTQTITWSTLKNGETLEIRQDPNRMVSLTVSTKYFAFLQPEFRYHFFYDRWWASFGFEQYVFGIFLSIDKDYVQEKGVIASFPMIVPYMGLGFYLDDSDSPLRSFISAHLGLRLLTDPWALDPLGFFHVGLGGGWEYTHSSNLSLSFRLGNDFIFPAPTEASFMNREKRLLILNLGPVLMQTPVFHGGFSWSF